MTITISGEDHFASDIKWFESLFDPFSFTGNPNDPDTWTWQYGTFAARFTCTATVTVLPPGWSFVRFVWTPNELDFMLSGGAIPPSGILCFEGNGVGSSKSGFAYDSNENVASCYAVFTDDLGAQRTFLITSLSSEKVLSIGGPLSLTTAFGSGQPAHDKVDPNKPWYIDHYDQTPTLSMTTYDNRLAQRPQFGKVSPRFTQAGIQGLGYDWRLDGGSGAATILLQNTQSRLSNTYCHVAATDDGADGAAYPRCKFKGEYRGDPFEFDDCGDGVPKPGERSIDTNTPNYYRLTAHEPMQVAQKGDPVHFDNGYQFNRTMYDDYSMQLTDKSSRPMMGSWVQERFTAYQAFVTPFNFTGNVHSGFTWTSSTPASAAAYTVDNAGLFVDRIGYAGVSPPNNNTLLFNATHKYYGGACYAGYPVPQGTAEGKYTSTFTMQVFGGSTTHQ